MSVNIFWMISFSCTHCGLFLLVQTEHHRAGFTHEFVIMKFYIFPSSGVEISPGRETGLRSKRAHSSEGGGGAGGAGAADLFEASDLSFSFTLSLSHSLHTGEFTDMDNFFGRVVNRKFSRCVSLPVNQLALFLCIKLKGSDLGLYRLFTPPAPCRSSSAEQRQNHRMLPPFQSALLLTHSFFLSHCFLFLDVGVPASASNSCSISLLTRNMNCWIYKAGLNRTSMPGKPAVVLPGANASAQRA